VTEEDLLLDLMIKLPVFLCGIVIDWQVVLLIVFYIVIMVHCEMFLIFVTHIYMLTQTLEPSHICKYIYCP